MGTKACGLPLLVNFEPHPDGRIAHNQWVRPPFLGTWTPKRSGGPSGFLVKSDKLTGARFRSPEASVPCAPHQVAHLWHHPTHRAIPAGTAQRRNLPQRQCSVSNICMFCPLPLILPFILVHTCHIAIAINPTSCGNATLQGSAKPAPAIYGDWRHAACACLCYL